MTERNFIKQDNIPHLSSLFLLLHSPSLLLVPLALPLEDVMRG